MAETNQQLAYTFCSEPNVLSNLAYIEKIDMFAWWNEAHSYFELLDKKSMQRRVYQYLFKSVKKNMTMAMVSDIVQHIKEHVERRFEDVISPYLGLSDFHVLNVEEFTLLPASQNIPCFHFAQVTSEEVESGEWEAPVFKAFLDDILVDREGNKDEELHLFLQEIFGYVLLPTLEIHASFFFVGKGGNGKSKVVDIIRDMMGGDTFCDGKSIETLTNKEFAVADLLGKRLNICSEEESKFVKSDKFKSLVSGDPISVRRLYEAGFMWTPTVKYIFSTNEMPSFSGFNEGLLRRIFILPFNYTVPHEKRDTRLGQKIRGEIGGVTLWALIGAKRLIENGFKFTIPKSVKETKEVFSENLSSALMFFNETVEEVSRVSGLPVNKEEFYLEYQSWCDKRGKKSLNYYNFYADLETAEKLTPNVYEGNTFRLVRMAT